jgi:hypothetical protein
MLCAVADKAPLRFAVEAASSIMHDSDIFQWTEMWRDRIPLDGFWQAEAA